MNSVRILTFDYTTITDWIAQFDGNLNGFTKKKKNSSGYNKSTIQKFKTYHISVGVPTGS